MLLYVVYMCEKSLNFTYAFKHYQQQCKWLHFSWATLSQCRTVVPHCCKGDAASQWEMAILGVSELRNP